MESIKRILFPVDLSENPEQLVPNVITMVDTFNSDLHLLFVVRIFQYFTNIYVPHPSISVFENELVEGANKKMEEFKRDHFGKLEGVHSAVILGDPAETILRYIDENNVDMIIMGTHGRKGLDRVFFGSVAERVIKGSPVPVLVVNPIKAAKRSEG